MKTLSIALALGLAGAGAGAQAAPIQWMSADGGNRHYYEFVSASLTWGDAISAAAQRSFAGLPGHLVTITSGAEQAFIDADVSTGALAWIGASDAGSEGSYTWRAGPEAGQALEYTNWHSGEPNNHGGTEHYVTDNWGDGWNDLSATDRVAGYYVEYSQPAPIPLPAGVLLMAGALGALGFVRRRG